MIMCCLPLFIEAKKAFIWNRINSQETLDRNIVFSVTKCQETRKKDLSLVLGMIVSLVQLFLKLWRMDFRL